MRRYRHLMIDEAGVPIGPPRIWDKKSDGPGLMMSRSFGDQVGHTLGIIAEPGIVIVI